MPCYALPSNFYVCYAVQCRALHSDRLKVRALLTYCNHLSGDEDNGEMGAWFVLSALGLFSTVPGDDYLVLGSPIFRHVRIWRGKCRKDGKTSDCDYGDRNTSNRSSADVSRSAMTRTAPRVFGFGRARPVRDDELPKGLVGMTSYAFPSDSSYLHIVALGTAPDVSKVSEITFDGSPLGATDFGSPQLRKNAGAVSCRAARCGILRCSVYCSVAQCAAL